MPRLLAGDAPMACGHGQAQMRRHHVSSRLRSSSQSLDFSPPHLPYNAEVVTC